LQRWARYVSPDGKRQDAAHCYIHPLLQDGHHSNLHLLLETKVVRVIFDESSPPHAIGVEYQPNEDHQPFVSLSKAPIKTVKANKLVVVSSGALGTPQVLERSGVGNPSILKILDIPIISDLPGVGENYQDHHLLLYPYKSSLQPEDTLDGLLSGRKDFVESLKKGDPMLGWNGIDICSKLRPSDAEIAELGPDFQADWDRDFKHQTERPLLLTGVVSAFLADPSLVEPGQYVTMGAYTAYPYSRGSIHVTDKTNVKDGYDFDTGFLNHPSDIKKQLWGYKKSRELVRRLPYYQGELALGHPKFPAGSAAGLVDLSNGNKDSNFEVNGEGMMGMPKIKYSKEDDAAIEDWIRGNLNTTWHSLGTCAMKPREAKGVVDGQLNVYGTRGLKVADLSIVPENVGANTYNTALVVGEKAAVIIGGELGIQGV